MEEVDIALEVESIERSVAIAQLDHVVTYQVPSEIVREVCWSGGAVQQFELYAASTIAFATVRAISCLGSHR